MTWGQRWDYWKGRFVWFQVVEGVSEEAKSFARAAVDAMDTVEEEPDRERGLLGFEFWRNAVEQRGLTEGQGQG